METNLQSFETKIKSSILDRDRQLVISDEYVEFDDKDSVATKPTRFIASDIVAFRYGIQYIKGYYFRIGWTYCLDIKSKDHRIIKIRLKSLYGFNKITQKYADIVNSLYTQIIDKISLNYLNQFYSTYYAIFSKSNPSIYKTFEFLTDWNTGILYGLSRKILMDKGLYSE